MPVADIALSREEAEIHLFARRAHVRKVDEALVDSLHHHAKRHEAVQHVDEALERPQLVRQRADLAERGARLLQREVGLMKKSHGFLFTNQAPRRKLRLAP